MKQEDFRRVIGSFEPSEEIKEKILSMNKPKVRLHRKLVTAATAFTIFLLTSATVFAAVNYFNLAELFRSTFEDDVTADNIEEGKLQKVGLTQSNEEISLTLDSFTGDSETHIVLFEMEYFGEINKPIKNIFLTGKTTNVGISKEEKESYATSEIQAYEVTYDETTKKIYGKYILPPFWVRDAEEDIVIDITGVSIRLENSLQTIHVTTDFEYVFAPDRTILQAALIVPVNQDITKGNDTLSIDEVIFSQYKTEINFTIKGMLPAGIDLFGAKKIWERFTYDYYYDNSFDWVKNDCYVQLFTDNMEVKTDEMFKDYYPGPRYHCTMVFQPVNYQNVQNIEIRFGDLIVPVDIQKGQTVFNSSGVIAEDNGDDNTEEAVKNSEDAVPSSEEAVKNSEEAVNSSEDVVPYSGKPEFRGLGSDQTLMLGNANINLMMGGYLCANEAAVYYRNDEDHGYLYKREEDGKKTKIYEASVGDINIMNGRIYFINKDDNNSICRVDQNGANYSVLRSGVAYWLMLTESRIFFMDKNYDLYQMDYEGNQVTLLTELKENDAWWINVYNDYVIYSGINNEFAVYYYDPNIGIADFKSIIQDYGFYPVVDGNYLYYQTKDGGINQCNLINGRVKELTDQWGQQFAVVQNTIYFTDYQGIWKISLDNSEPPEQIFTSVDKSDPEHWVYKDIKINWLCSGMKDVFFNITEGGTDKLMIYHTDTGVIEGF